MNRAVVLFFALLMAVAPACAQKIVPNDPSQNPLMASGTISPGLSGTLDSSARLKVTISNPTMEPVPFTIAEAIFVQGGKEKGHPLYAERLEVPPLSPGQTIDLRFRYPNPQDVSQISAYVLLEFITGGQKQRTALFIEGPKQRNLADKWDNTFFPYGHYTGFISTEAYVQAPYWGRWDDFAPFWW